MKTRPASVVGGTSTTTSRARTSFRLTTTSLSTWDLATVRRPPAACSIAPLAAHVKPTLVVVLILRTVFSFMVFDEILAITYGRPGDSTWTAAWYIYSFAFRFYKFGPASAASFIVTLAIAAIAALYIWLLYRRVE